MPDANDMELLAEYGRHGSEAAFAELVRRHVALVYSAAVRHVGVPAQAEEITQVVFIILAQKATRLRPGTILEGWLYETTRLTALSFLRGERRRQRREQEAYMQSTMPEPTDPTWDELAPFLDEAMSRLGTKDRDLVILRFFKNRSVREVAAAMQVNEAVAQRQILRALDKLRKIFASQGVHSTSVVIGETMSGNAMQAAPVALAQSVTAAALAKGAAASTSTLTLIQGALKLMAWTKAQAIIVTGVAVVLAAGTATVVVEKVVQPYGPFYHGRPLSVWLKQYNDFLRVVHGRPVFDAAKWHETNKIVREAGTNAIPTLLRLLREDDVKKHNLDNGVDMAYAALGATAKDSVPSLIQIYEQNPSARGEVLYCLGCIGPDADSAVPWLLQQFPGTSGELRHGVIEALGGIHTQPGQVVPVLMNCLNESDSHIRAEAALALANYGADAKPAIPQLIALLKDKGKGVKNCAIFAIEQIDPATAAKLGLK